MENQEIYSEQESYSTLEGFEGLMGARNTRASQSPLYSEIEALIWAIEYTRILNSFLLLLQWFVFSW